MITTDDLPPGVEERYTAAGNTSDLRVEADIRGDADLMIAAGWSPSRLGAAMLRLHSEWDAVEKPHKPTQEAIDALAMTLPRITQPDGTTIADVVHARTIAGEWYLHELRLLVGKLKALPQVRMQLAMQAHKWFIPNPQETAGAVIKYWLDQTCNACDGRKWRLIPGSPSLSNRMCPACNGTGYCPPPCGQAGRKLANHMDFCVDKARQSIKRRLRSNADDA